jgi:uncharacterized protein Yka (UPF0111/DUF47 family)
MEPTDLTLEVLNGIRQELRETRDALGSRIDGTNERLDAMAEQAHGMREELSRRIVESEIRTSTAIADLAGTVREMTSVLRAANDLRPRVERCEHDIADIKRRVG